VIHVRIDSEEEAFEIFETTNARGVDLSVGDLLKNVILKKLADDGSAAKEVWDAMIENVADANLDLKRFLRYHWISKNGPCSAKNLFREIKKETIATQDWEHLLQNLAKDGQILEQLVSNSRTDWMALGFDREVASSLHNIQRLGFTVSYPFLFRLVDGYKQLGQRPRKILETIENFTFLYNAVGEGRVSSCEAVYFRHALMLNQALQQSDDRERHKDVAKTLASLETELVRLIPTREIFKEKFSEKVVYSPRKKTARDLVKYVLLKVNSAMQPTREIQIDETQVNIEHVLPQDPTEHWGLTKKDVASYVNSIGNLTLLDQRLNSRGGNKPFEIKSEVLSESQIKMNEQLVTEMAKANGWTKDLILSRGERLADYAWEHVWHINRPNQNNL